MFTARYGLGIYAEETFLNVMSIVTYISDKLYQPKMISYVCYAIL